MPRPSRFQGILDAAREPDAPPEPEPEPVAEPPPARRPGRPAVGKKSDPEYTQVTAYVRRDRYRDVRIALLQDGGRRDFSELVDGLLAAWLEDRGSGEAVRR